MRAASRAVRIGGARVARPRGASGNAGAKHAPVRTSEICDRTGIAGRYRAEIPRRGFSVDDGARRGGGDARAADPGSARVEHGLSARLRLILRVLQG